MINQSMLPSIPNGRRFPLKRKLIVFAGSINSPDVTDVSLAVPSYQIVKAHSVTITRNEELTFTTGMPEGWTEIAN